MISGREVLLLSMSLRVGNPLLLNHIHLIFIMQHSETICSYIM